MDDLYSWAGANHFEQLDGVLPGKGECLQLPQIEPQLSSG